MLHLRHLPLQLVGPLHQAVVGGHLLLQLLDAVGGQLVGHQDASKGPRQRPDQRHPRHSQRRQIHPLSPSFL